MLAFDAGAQMAIRLVFLSAVLIIFLSSDASSQTSSYTAVAYQYADLAYPGAMVTNANGINNNNVIVGSYFDSTSSVHGFIYRNGKYKKVDVPGSSETELHGVNDKGDIVGVYQTPGPLNSHGFLLHEGQFTTIDAPQATFGTTAMGINNDMSIVGTFDDSRAFILRNGIYKTYKMAKSTGAAQTQLNGINNLGWIAGQVSSGETWRGFWQIGSDLDFLEPQSASDNQVTGINGRGDIVGCHDATSGFVSFRVEVAERTETKEAVIDQQKLPSCASAINYSRVIVGNYFRIGQLNAFVAVPRMTISVTGPARDSSTPDPVHLMANATGVNPISQIQVWVDFKEQFHVNGGKLDATLNLPVGTNERLVIQAIDSKGNRAKVVTSITVQ